LKKGFAGRYSDSTLQRNNQIDAAINPYRNIIAQEIPMALSLPATPEQFAAANKSAFDTLLSTFNSALDSAEKLIALNISSTRTTVDAQVSNAKASLSAKDLHDALALQGSLAQPQVEKAIAYGRRVYEISAEAHEQLLKRLEWQQSEFNKSIASLLDSHAENGTGSSQIAFAAVKSAISAANSAFDNVNKAARQVANITEASVDAASSATVRAVGATTQARKKAA
jgi:phasin family protein